MGAWMKQLAALVIICAVALGTTSSPTDAQDKPTVVGKPRYTAAEMRKRISGGIPVTCVLADKTKYLVDTTVAVAGKTYRCVTVLDENLQPSGAAWTPVQ
jgi:hypothetical protein